MARWASTTKKSKTLESLVLWLQATIAQALVQLLHHHHHFIIIILIIRRGRSSRCCWQYFVMFLSSSVVNTTTASAFEVSFWLEVSTLLLSSSLTFAFYFFVCFSSDNCSKKYSICMMSCSVTSLPAQVIISG